MKSLSRVVWSEGMYLGPHQFQLQTRYVEDSIGFAIAALWQFQFGFTGLQLDAEALRNGTVSLLHARGILPDGTAFHIPQCDGLPAPRSVGNVFPPTADTVTVSLCLPERRPGGANLSDAIGGITTRYRPETLNFCDENTGVDERAVSIGRKRFDLVFDMESKEGCASLPLGRVRRDGSGQFIYDPEFIPPCLQIGASEPLLRLIQRLIEILESKSATLSRSSGPGGTRDYSPREIAGFWLLHAVNSALPPLRHILVTKRGHPEELFVELSRMAGSLCTFALNSDPTKLPLWDHLNPGPGFLALYEHIRRHLETVVPTNCITIALRRTTESMYTAEISDTRCFGRCRWILAVRSSLGEAALVTRTIQLAKICSAKFIGDLVRRAIAGLPLRHLPVPPSAIPAKVESQYFAISKEGPFWESIVQTRGVGVYLPGDIPNAEVEIFVVLDS